MELFIIADRIHSLSQDRNAGELNGSLIAKHQHSLQMQKTLYGFYLLLKYIEGITPETCSALKAKRSQCSLSTRSSTRVTLLLLALKAEHDQTSIAKT